MPFSVIISPFIAILVGFAGSIAVILSASDALQATPAQTSSMIAALCFATAVTSGFLSFRYKMPIITAWSTPGAALIATTSGISFEAAIGAFIVAALCMIATGAITPLERLIAKIPTPIASAMLAGVVMPFVLKLFQFAPSDPILVVTIFAIFLLIRFIFPTLAVLLPLTIGITMCLVAGTHAPFPAFHFTQPVFIMPIFELSSAIGLGVPLYLVTMASQNLPGFAVLRAANYEPPVSGIILTTAIASLLTAPFGAHATNLAAITAAICTGEDNHKDPKKRWLCGPPYMIGYFLLSLFAASIVALLTAFPPQLIAAIAAIGLMTPLVGALGQAMSDDKCRFAATLTFVATASGFSIFGIGAAFWGLLIGLLVLSLENMLRNK